MNIHIYICTGASSKDTAAISRRRSLRATTRLAPPGTHSQKSARH